MKYILGILCIILLLLSFLFFKGIINMPRYSLKQDRPVVNKDQLQNNNIESFKTERDLVMRLSIVSEDDHISDNEMDIIIKLYDDIVPLTCKNFRHIF